MLTDDKPQSGDIVRELAQIVGDDRVLLSETERSFYASDVCRAGAIPLAVVQPGSVDELCAVVRAADVHRLAIVPRGGGASYTDAYLPIDEQSLLVDTSRLNRIVTVNSDDMYVTVECGVTWAQLDERLKELGLRTPFWGTFSGQRATVGGSATQGSVSMGTGAFGISADSVLGFEVVLSDGTLMRTGAHAAANGTPFFRHYGPDLTGLFCNDAGALGVKARITLRLIKRPLCNGTCSFGFSNFDAMANAMAAVARENVADINMGLDPGLQQGQIAETSAADTRRAAIAVFKDSRNVFEGIWRLLKLAVAGKRFFGAYPYSAHFVVDGATRAIVNSKLAILRHEASPFGEEIAASVPTVIAAMPFIPLNGVMGPGGERCLPQHGIMPFSKVTEFHRKLRELLAANENDMKANKIFSAEMFMTVGNNGFLYEPVFYWQDTRVPYATRILDDDYLATLPTYEANHAARELVDKLRAAIQSLFADVGAVHLQIGKTYPYLKDRQAAAAQLISQIKFAVDPKSLMNPGALDNLNQREE